MSEFDDLLCDAYRGEVLGEAFFRALADAQDDDTRRETLRVLQTVEARTAARLRPLVDAAGIDPGDAPSATDGARMAEAVAGQPWDGLLRSLRGALPEFLVKFERLQSLASDPDDPIMAELVAHERAIDRFAQLELDGRSDDALGVLREHLESFRRAGAH